MREIIGWARARALFVLGCGVGLVACDSTRHDQALFTAAQADHGKAFYAQKCASCHGGDLVGGVAPNLKGSKFADSWGPLSMFAKSLGRPFTVDDLAYFVTTTMPPGEAPSVAPEDHAAVVAYVLQSNGYPRPLAH